MIGLALSFSLDLDLYRAIIFKNFTTVAKTAFSTENAANLSFSVFTLLSYLFSTMIRLLLTFLCAMALIL